MLGRGVYGQNPVHGVLGMVLEKNNNNKDLSCQMAAALILTDAQLLSLSLR